MTYKELKELTSKLKDRVDGLVGLVTAHQEFCMKTDSAKVPSRLLMNVSNFLDNLGLGLSCDKPDQETTEPDNKSDPTEPISKGTWVAFNYSRPTDALACAEVTRIGVVEEVQTTRKYSDGTTTKIPTTYKILRIDVNGPMWHQICPTKGHSLKVIRPFTRRELETLPYYTMIRYRITEPVKDESDCRLVYSSTGGYIHVNRTLTLSGDDNAPEINGNPQEFYFARGAVYQTAPGEDWKPFCKEVYTVEADK